MRLGKINAKNRRNDTTQSKINTIPTLPNLITDMDDQRLVYYVVNVAFLKNLKRQMSPVS